MSQAGNNSSQIKQLFKMTYEETNKCIQCGYCLPACPTYQSMGKESASPRGRINLVKMAAEGKISIEEMAVPVELCLSCRACEPACPVGVPYGHILEAAKQVKEEVDPPQENQKTSTPGNKWRDFALEKGFPYPKRMRVAGNLLYFCQKSGLADLLVKSKIIERVSRPLFQLERIVPELESPRKRKKTGVIYPAHGEKKCTVAFFAGCIMDTVMSRTNRLTVELLQRIGCEVIIPKGQQCCGALHVHQGKKQLAKELAILNIETFAETQADYYVNNAGGCGAMLVEYPHLFADDPEWINRAQDFASKARDISQILWQYGPLPFTKELDQTVTYQESCHLKNVQGVSEEPRQLLQSIPGVCFVEMKESDRCCASGGIYNITHYDESMKILDAKMVNVKEINPDTIVTGNPGCLLQMKLGVERNHKQKETRVLHLVELLAEACGIH